MVTHSTRFLFTYRRKIEFRPTKSPVMITSLLLSFRTGRPLTVTESRPVKLPPTLIMPPPINRPPPVFTTVRAAGACSALQYSQVLNFVGAPQFGQFMIFSFGLCPIAAWRLKLRKKLLVVLSASRGGGAAGTY